MFVYFQTKKHLAVVIRLSVYFQANKHLAEENEDLNAQLLASAVNKGRILQQEGNSLAQELDHLTKEEVG